MLRLVVGAAPVLAGRGERIRGGVTVRGMTLRIRLVRPAGEFLPNLAQAAFCAVPPDLKRHIVVRPPLPSAGPYYFARSTTGRYGEMLTFTLLRNPWYRGSRPHRPGQIVVTNFGDTHEGTRRVQAGESDWLFVARIVQGVVTNVAGRTLDLRWLSFNTRSGPFRSLRLRRAVAHALDRKALLVARGKTVGQATDHLASTLIPGQSARPFFTPSGGDEGLSRARELAEGLVPVTVTLNADFDLREAEVIRDRLAEIGVAVRIFRRPVVECHPSTFDLSIDDVYGGSVVDRGYALEELIYPEPQEIADCFDTRLRTPPAAWARRFEHAKRLRGAERGAALAKLERDLATQFVPATGLYVPYAASLFSTRIGCRRPHRVYQVDIAALCLRR